MDIVTIIINVAFVLFAVVYVIGTHSIRTDYAKNAPHAVEFITGFREQMRGGFRGWPFWVLAVIYVSLMTVLYYAGAIIAAVAIGVVLLRLSVDVHFYMRAYRRVV